MSGRALTYVAEFFGTDSTPEVRKSTLWTPYRESIGSPFWVLGFVPNGLWFWRLKSNLPCFVCCEYLRLLRMSEIMTLR